MSTKTDLDSGLGNAREDLEFVRRAVVRDDAGGFPAPIALLWAVISVVGFPLADFVPRWSAPFWAVAGPLGFGLSVWLGAKSARAAGEVDRREADRWTLHWLGLVGAMALAALAPVAGIARWDDFAALVLLLLAVAYFTAGIHLHRPLLLVAAILAAGYVVVLFAPGPTWTYVGVATAAALTGVALLGRRRRGDR
jgi:hypothetical protein